MTLSFAAVALLEGTALAGVKVAVPCDKAPLHCARAPIGFSHVDALPIEWNFDTGWVPQNSPLQVHIWAGVYAHTRIGLQGAYVTSWDADDAGLLTLRTPGDPLGGSMNYHYGAELGAQGAVHVTILGQNYDWVGDLPYVPQFDFQVEADGAFDAWAFPPGFSLTSKTAQQKLAQIGVADIIGASIPGIDGGFELDVAMELTATYTTTRIVMTEKDQPVLGGPIMTEDGISSMSYSGGPFTEVDVRPEGMVDYDGTLHLIPAFYIELLGKSWSIPIADIPMAFPITQVQWSFDPVTVHTPLPDLFVPVTELDFGEVEVGQKNLEALELTNEGEAKLAIAATGETDAFEIFEPSLEIDPKKTIQAAYRFVPKHAGEFKTTVLLTSNDPDNPLQKVVLKGTGVDGPPLQIETDPALEEDDDVELQGACACRAGGGGSDAGGLSLLVIGMAVTAARSRSRRRR
jgi:hypothetical protein